MEPIVKLNYSVAPAKAGAQKGLKRLDSGFRRNDEEGVLQLALWDCSASLAMTDGVFSKVSQPF